MVVIIRAGMFFRSSGIHATGVVLAQVNPPEDLLIL